MTRTRRLTHREQHALVAIAMWMLLFTIFVVGIVGHIIASLI